VNVITFVGLVHYKYPGATGSEHVGSVRLPGITVLLDLTQYSWKIVDGRLSVSGSQRKTEML
jgi:hypothetical protein